MQQKPPFKQISWRLDGDVIEKFKTTSKGWQNRVNEVLRKAAGLSVNDSMES
jgi:uncharacterized protein (DUF4415 family)